jgi:electron transfer flavoprotein alpha subunit
MSRALVVVEHEAGRVRPASLAALSFAKLLDPTQDAQVEALLLGVDLGNASEAAAHYCRVIVGDHEALRHPVADRHARIIADVAVATNCDFLIAASTSYAKDTLGRAAGLLEGAMASDVVGFESRGGRLLFRRALFAGGLMATIALSGRPRIITIRPSAFPIAECGTPREIEQFPVDASRLTNHIEFEAMESRASHRPDLTEARVVVSGGRAFKSTEDFEAHVGALADCLGGAAGSTRALVDAGITPNELQVGQTGKIVAPELYFALGLSGAIQHMAGMKNSKVIVAINHDPQAPIFEFANYGLVADVHAAVPRLIAALSK